ncbi:hypothetical protein DFP72DRAFT_848219 [Ephemerocybe angulata]|uniref:Uncharacterized protein n=1 Tax=Ephemerocybe angulata TaxID=980116 RepID=A0A8H6HWX5_9AGAR|nr:hypothetical protein DFP72DRAFT_848219 [Tulosesus angulatus]
MPSSPKTSRPSVVNPDGAHFWQGARHFTIGNVTNVNANNYHAHAQGNPNEQDFSLHLAHRARQERRFPLVPRKAGAWVHPRPPRNARAQERRFPPAHRARQERRFPLAPHKAGAKVHPRPAQGRSKGSPPPTAQCESVGSPSPHTRQEQRFTPAHRAMRERGFPLAPHKAGAWAPACNAKTSRPWWWKGRKKWGKAFGEGARFIYLASRENSSKASPEDLDLEDGQASNTLPLPGYWRGKPLRGRQR